MTKHPFIGKLVFQKGRNGHTIYFTECFIWCHLLAEVLRRPQNTHPKRNVTWPRLPIHFKRWKPFFGRVVECKLVWLCLECFAWLTLQQALHTRVGRLLKLLCRLWKLQGSPLLWGDSAPAIRCQIHTLPIQISPRWSPRPQGQGQPATPGLGRGNAVLWQQAGVERVSNHTPQGAGIDSGQLNMFCGEHPVLVPKLCIVNLWKRALSTWVSLRCYNISFSGDGSGFPTRSRESSTSVKSMGGGWLLWLVVGMPSLGQFVSPLVVMWVSGNKQSSRKGTDLDLVCCANVVIHCRCLGVLRVCVYILLIFFTRSKAHISAALGKAVNTLTERKVIWSNSREIKEWLENNNASSNLEKCKLEENNLRLKYAERINSVEEMEEW